MVSIQTLCILVLFILIVILNMTSKGNDSAIEADARATEARAN